MKISSDPGIRALLERARNLGIETVWDRCQTQLPQCGFGELGVCCHNCSQGPCRIDPFGNGPRSGVCGAGRDTLASSTFVRAVTAGTAALSVYAKGMVRLVSAPGREIKNMEKLEAVAGRLGLNPVPGPVGLLQQLADTARAEFSFRDEPPAWILTTLTKGRIDSLGKAGALPQGIDSSIAESVQRSAMGATSDPLDLLLSGVKCAVAGFAASRLASDLADIVFGAPQPAVTSLAPNSESQVNIAVQGFDRALTQSLEIAAGELADEAKVLGATGFNVMALGWGQSILQELSLLTGLWDAVAVTGQCSYPSLSDTAGWTGTKIFAAGLAGMPGVFQLDQEENGAGETGRKIVREALGAFKVRQEKAAPAPGEARMALMGFSYSSILSALAELNPADPLQFLLESIVKGRIQGIALIGGCPNVKMPLDESFLVLARELARRDILLLTAGCGAGSFARHGMLTSGATHEYAGPGLKSFLTAVGEASGAGGPWPLLLHLGGCPDICRAIDLAVDLANKLGVDLSRLPFVFSLPEYSNERALTFALSALALGLPVHLGITPPVMGSNLMVNILTGGVKDLFGGYFILESDPYQAVNKLSDAISQRRKGLSLGVR